jgi:hypothetical protein
MSSKFNFTLKGIDHKNIIERYSLSIAKDEKSSGVTKISELNSKKDANSFIDDIKTDKKYIITMLDYLSNQQLPKKTDLHCWWCRHPFDTVPVGCPLKYVPTQIEKKYYSEIHKENYTILHNISSLTISKLNIPKDSTTGNYYETDGIFCSFNCCLSFIQDNGKNPIYVQSRTLLGKIYTELYDTPPLPPYDIKPAPHWRLLKQYGGNMTIQDFKDNFSKIIESLGSIREFPKLKPVGWVYGKKL